MDAMTPTDAKAFSVMLDRFGTDFGRWPAAYADQAKKLLIHSADARHAYDVLARIEALIDSSRPAVAPASIQRTVARTLAAVAAREATPSLLDRFRVLFAAPLPRAAFAMCLTGIGFAIGIAIGNPTTERAIDAPGSSFLLTSADDVLF